MAATNSKQIFVVGGTSLFLFGLFTFRHSFRRWLLRTVYSDTPRVGKTVDIDTPMVGQTLDSDTPRVGQSLQEKIIYPTESTPAESRSRDTEYLTVEECQLLTSLLAIGEDESSGIDLHKALITIANRAAFTYNQVCNIGSGIQPHCLLRAFVFCNLRT